MVTQDTYLVICLDIDVYVGGWRYVLATRQVFWTRAEADAYADTVAASRNPIVVAGPWGELRQPPEPD